MLTMNITQALPTPESVLQFEPEELAGYVLGHFSPENDQMHPTTFLGEVEKHYEYDKRANRVFMEAWAWLVREGLFVGEGDGDGEFFFSHRGKRIRGRQDFEAYRKSNILPKLSLHPTIAERIWPNFIRGEYDTTVFQAFKEVEVAVRTAGRFAATDIGTDLMGKALNNLPDRSLTRLCLKLNAARC